MKHLAVPITAKSKQNKVTKYLLSEYLSYRKIKMLQDDDGKSFEFRKISHCLDQKYHYKVGIRGHL